MADPKLWGPHMWHMLHYVAIGYPEEPDMAARAAYRTFFVNLGAVLPCTVCAENYARHLSELPIDAYLDGGPRRLFEWTVLLHNIVNVENGKPPVMDIAAMYDQYLGGGEHTRPCAAATMKTPTTALDEPFHPIVLTSIILVSVIVGGFVAYVLVAKR